MAEFTFGEAAQRVLEDAGEPLHYTTITERALAAGLVETSGKTPWDTMNARICVDLQRRGDKSPFIRVSAGVFGLRRWVEEGRLAMPAEATSKVRVPGFPTYSTVRAILPVWTGLEPWRITGLQRAIREWTGSRTEQVDWTDPEVWIVQRLEAGDRDLAMTTWKKAGLNPRYMTGCWLLATGYGLLAEGPDGRLRLTESGEEFAAKASGDTVRRIDDDEGLLALLALLADQGPTTPADLVAGWVAFLKAETRIESDTYARSTLRARLANLHERGLVDRNGRIYAITEAGLGWLRVGGAVEGPAAPSDEQQIRELAERQRKRVREGMLELLADMDPYDFEHVVKTLLEEMGYEDAEVTAPSNDKGVDVVATIRLGISEVREVVQVKRHRGNIHRPVLDALRGSLHRFRAVRGTIITTGGFAKGTINAAFEPGAAPITLIDGERLVDLLFEHQIGAKRREVVVWELDPTAFSSSDDET